jgi:hypothetical protein
MEEKWYALYSCAQRHVQGSRPTAQERFHEGTNMQELQLTAPTSSSDSLKPTAEDQSPSGQERRIRSALGLARGPLPPVTRQWLRAYYAHLLDRLAFPFDAPYAEESIFSGAVLSPVTVVGLVDPEAIPDQERSGLLCKAFRGQQELCIPLSDVELADSSPNFQLIEDYWYWFWNWRFDPSI